MSSKQQNSVKEILMKNFKNVQQGTNFILKAIPKDKLDYQPTIDMRKMGDLAFQNALLPLTCTMFAQGMFKERPDQATMQKVLAEKLGSAVKENNYPAMFAKACEYMFDFYGKKTDNDWLNTTYTTFINPNPISFLQGFVGIEDHLIQHRGTLFAYLRTLNIPVTMKQYFGMEDLK